MVTYLFGSEYDIALQSNPISVVIGGFCHTPKMRVACEGIYGDVLCGGGEGGRDKTRQPSIQPPRRRVRWHGWGFLFTR